MTPNETALRVVAVVLILVLGACSVTSIDSEQLA